MIKIPAIFKQLHSLLKQHPGVFGPVAFALTMPGLGSLIALNLLFQSSATTWGHVASDALTQLVFIILAAIAMGLALLPTTFIAVLTGLIWGWTFFVHLVTAYTLATAIGYFLGRAFTGNQLPLLLQPFPKAQEMVTRNAKHPAKLIFLIRLSPVIPFALSNILFSLMKVPVTRVLWWGLWGMLPRTSIAFFSGTLAANLIQAFREGRNDWEWIAVLFLFLISTYGLIRIFKK